jgi:LysM repeat protein
MDHVLSLPTMRSSLGHPQGEYCSAFFIPWGGIAIKSISQNRRPVKSEFEFWAILRWIFEPLCGIIGKDIFVCRADDSPEAERRPTSDGRCEMRREWLIALLVVVLLVPVGCGTTAQADTDTAVGGLSASETHTVQIEELVSENLSPKAVISGPTSGSVGETLNFSGAGSSDDDGRIVSYTWDFGDGTTGSGVNVTHKYSAAGSYKVTLEVTDNGGATDIVVLSNGSPTTPGTRTYTVQSGDTLMEISRKLFNGDPQYWDEIAALNDIKAPYTIYPGQELEVPEK